jgi:hypothetical protein
MGVFSWDAKEPGCGEWLPRCQGEWPTVSIHDRSPAWRILATNDLTRRQLLTFIGASDAIASLGTPGTQLDCIADTTGAEFGLVGEKYGWLVEIDPRVPTSLVKKHTALGRFRHENIAIRAETGHHSVVDSDNHF